MPRLLLQPDRPDEREIVLSEGTHVIGRTEESEVFVLNRSLSRRHARLEVGADGSTVITDLGSFNGTFVDDERIEEKRLAGGETIRCGGVLFRFELDRRESRRESGADGDTASKPSSSRDIHADLTRLSMGEVLRASEKRTGHAEERLRILLKVSQILASPAPVDQLLETVLDLAFEILDIDRAAVLLVDPETDRLEPRVVKTADGVSATGPIFSQHIVEYVRRRSVAALFGDAQADPRLSPARSVLLQSICASMCAPLKPRDEVIGVLYVDNLSQAGRFDDGDLDFLSAFANQAAVALDNAALFSKLEREAVVRHNLLRFFPPKAISRLMEGDELSLGVQETEVTALFCDICGFTRLSASMAPRQVLELLNRYFPVMSDVVFRHEGTLEKYIGDALMAVWGAPFRDPEDPVRAVRAAVEMQHALRALNEESGPLPDLKIHIGVNTGVVAAGNVGSERYIQYATLGDATNLASRLCDLAGADEIYVAATTVERLGGPQALDWPVEDLGAVRIEGREEPLRAVSLRWRE